MGFKFALGQIIQIKIKKEDQSDTLVKARVFDYFLHEELGPVYKVMILDSGIGLTRFESEIIDDETSNDSF